MQGQFDVRELEECVAVANIPTLIPLLVQFTGDTRWLEPPYQPRKPQGIDNNDDGGLPPEIQQVIRQAALEAIKNWLTGTPAAFTVMEPELLLRSVEVALGEKVPEDYGEMLADLLHVDEVESFEAVAERALHDKSAIIIGAGMSGIAAAVEFDKVGLHYTIFERNSQVGGTWLENRYPGCGVDVPSHLYEFSFAPNDWTHYFSLRDDILEYFCDVAERYGVMDHVVFNTTVSAAKWNEDEQQWVVTTSDEEGHTTTHCADYLVTAVGAFSSPRTPDLPGISEFRGQMAHTAQWPHDFDVSDKRVALVGTGASSMQIMPLLATQVSNLTIFQRSPQWASPFPQLHAEIPKPIRRLMEICPPYRAWFQARLSWIFNDRIHPALVKDPEWPHPERSVNAQNDGYRRALTRYIESELGDRRDLLDLVLPDYPPFGKRILLDNGWYRTLRRENVELIRGAVERVTEHGLVDDRGREYDVDAIIWAIGFDVVHLLSSVDITGRNGAVLSEVWHGDDPRAYLGLTVPGFPNFFCLYGPNTQFGHGGSLVGVMERQVRYMCGLMGEMARRNATSFEVKPTVFDAYNDSVDQAHEGLIWTHHGMSTYYRNSKGRVVVPNPFRVVEVWKQRRQINEDDYVFSGTE